MEEAVKRAPHARAQAVQSVVFTWGELRFGDCHQINGRLTLSSDGTGSWSCTTWTDHTHSGDNWQCHFDVLSGDGASLFNTPQFTSPRMDDGDPPSRYQWGNAFAFNPDLFDAIGQVEQSYSC